MTAQPFRIPLSNGELSIAENIKTLFTSNTKTNFFGLYCQRKVAGQMARWANYELAQISRCSGLATQFGWMMFSILAFSPAFLEAAANASPRVWDALERLIVDNYTSLEMFAKTRELPWQSLLEMAESQIKELREDEIQSRYNIKDPVHPHQWYLDLNGIAQPTMYAGDLQENTDECIYEEDYFVERSGNPDGAPSYWPQGWNWPMDPGLMHENTACSICGLTNCTTCGPENFYNPLIELIETKDRGRAVRALQQIPAGRVLAEFTGQIIPLQDNIDPTYALTFDVLGRKDVALISPAEFGNWTRFINHSCDANSMFQSCVVGGRGRMTVESERDIDMFDEITVDYGDAYWTTGMLCKCGSPNCRIDTPEKSKALVAKMAAEHGMDICQAKSPN